MVWFSHAVSVLIAIAIVIVGLMYLFAPRLAMQSFGLPLPGPGANVSWWLRLKGVRDIVSGLVLFAVLAWADAPMLGTTLLIQALIPAGDMALVLAARGSVVRALAIHGFTAALMLAAALCLLLAA